MCICVVNVQLELLILSEQVQLPNRSETEQNIQVYNIITYYYRIFSAEYML